MPEAKSNYLERSVLDHVLGVTSYSAATTLYVALYETDPGDDNSGTEVSGGSYARQSVTFDAATTDVNGNSVSASNVQLKYTDMPAVTVSHVGILDASTGGNLLYYGPLSENKTLTAGDNFIIEAGNLTVQER